MISKSFIEEVLQEFKTSYPVLKPYFYEKYDKNGNLTKWVSLDSVEKYIPTYCIDSLFSEYESEKMSISQIIKIIVERFEASRTPDQITESKQFLLDFELVCNRVQPRLCRWDNNEQLQNKPNRSFLDYQIYYVIEFGGLEEVSTALPISNELLESWEKTEDELYNIAILNNQRVDYQVKPLNEYLGTNTESSVYYVSNKSGLYGSNQMLNSFCLKAVSTVLGNEFWVVPSSIHEFLAASCNVYNRVSLANILHEQNKGFKEILGRKVHSYSIFDGWK